VSDRRLADSNHTTSNSCFKRDNRTARTSWSTPIRTRGRPSSTASADAPANCGSSAMARKAVSRLPLSLAPRGLSGVQAAEYIGVGVTKF
jgi:hypothetical protein